MNFLHRIFPRYRQVAVNFFTPKDAERMVRETSHLPDPQRWRVAKDDPLHFWWGMVRLERRERV